MLGNAFSFCFRATTSDSNPVAYSPRTSANRRRDRTRATVYGATWTGRTAIVRGNVRFESTRPIGKSNKPVGVCLPRGPCADERQTRFRFFPRVFVSSAAPYLQTRRRSRVIRRLFSKTEKTVRIYVRLSFLSVQVRDVLRERRPRETDYSRRNRTGLKSSICRGDRDHIV